MSFFNSTRKNKAEKLTKQWASHNRLRNLSKIEKKKKNCKKNKRNVVKCLNFSATFHKMIFTKKNLVNWYLSIP